MHPPRSSVMIQEMELQLMVSLVTTGHASPAIKAADVNVELPLKDTMRATPDNVAKALESAVGLNFNHYYKKKRLRTGRRGIPPTP